MARIRRPQIALVALLAALGIGYAVDAARGHSPGPPTPAVSTAAPSQAVPLSSLPVQARTTVALIQRGGPFPFPEDGEVFDDREHLLPAEPRGYYHAYTVVTPGDDDRGERRIVVGGGVRGQYWYTADHYASFRRVDLAR